MLVQSPETDFATVISDVKPNYLLKDLTVDCAQSRGFEPTRVAVGAKYEGFSSREKFKGVFLSRKKRQRKD